MRSGCPALVLAIASLLHTTSLAGATLDTGIPDIAGIAAGESWPKALPAAAPGSSSPWSLQPPGGALADGSQPIVVRMKDVPTGDPRAMPGVLRGHEQGRAAGAVPPDFVLGDPSDDAGASFGPAPAAAAAGLTPEAPDAPGDLRRNFAAQGASGWIPPDPVLAVGPKYILEVLNSGFTVFSKDGGLDRSYTDLQTFFDPILDAIPCAFADCFVFDPRAIYSQFFNKFVLAALVRDDTHNRSYIVFAISQTSNPLGEWWQYFTYDVSSTADAWTDYSGMSADPWGLYFTGNNWFYTGGFKYAIAISIRPDVFFGSWNGGWDFWDLRWAEPGNPQAFDLQPAVPTHGSPGDAATFFVNTFNSSGSKASIWKLTGDRGSSPTLVTGSANVSPYADPGLARQPAPGADDIEMFYAGSQNVAYSQRHVYLALNDAGSGQSGFYVSKINVDSFSEARNITYYTGDTYYYYPNVVLFGSDSEDPLVAVALSWSSDSVFPSGALKLFQNFTVDNTGAFWDVASGSATYNVYFNGRNRWGDYLGIARDHSCDTAWSVTEYAPATGVWRTRISEILGDRPQTGLCNLIFDDGFERSSSANWSAAVP
jgi:hypothetical protein